VDCFHVFEVNPFKQGFFPGFIVFDQVGVLHEYAVICRGIIHDHARQSLIFIRQCNDDSLIVVVAKYFKLINHDDMNDNVSIIDTQERGKMF